MMNVYVARKVLATVSCDCLTVLASVANLQTPIAKHSQKNSAFV